MSQLSEDDTERRSAVSNTRFHDNSSWQGPRPHGLPVMNHLPWRWGNTHRCTHAHAKTHTQACGKTHRDAHAHAHVPLFCQIGFQITPVIWQKWSQEKKKTHILVYIKRIVFQLQPVELRENWLYVQPWEQLTPQLNAQLWLMVLSHTWCLWVHVCMYMSVCLCMYVCASML